MRYRVLLAGIALAFGVLIATAHPARAEEGVFPVRAAGRGNVRRMRLRPDRLPARAPICDDPKVAIPVDVNEGLGSRV